MSLALDGAASYALRATTLASEPSSATIPDLWCMHEVWGLRPDVSKRRCSSKLGRASSSKSQCQPSARLAYVHARSSRTRRRSAFDDTCRPRQPVPIACSCKSHKNTAPAITGWLQTQITRHATAAINNHDARRDDDATYRKTRKNSECLRAPTARTEVRLVSREGVQSRS